MRNLSRYIILIVCVLISFETIAEKLSVAAPSASRYAVSSPTLKTSGAKVQAIITGFGSTSCVTAGAVLTVLGNNFGSLKGLSLVTGSSHIPLKITVWQDSKITAYLPTSGTMKTGTRYPVGIRDLRTNAWLSNIDKTILTCQPKSTGPRITKPTSPPTSGAKIVSPPDPIASAHPDNQDGYEPEQYNDYNETDYSSTLHKQYCLGAQAY